MVARQLLDNIKQKSPENQCFRGLLQIVGGLDGTRTRDPLRDRQVF